MVSHSISEVKEPSEEGTAESHIRQRLLDFRRMSWSTRALVAVVIAQIAVVSVLLFAGNSLPADVALGYAPNPTSVSLPIAIPLPIYIITSVSLLIGTFLSLVASLRLSMPMRLGVTIVVIIVIGALPFGFTLRTMYLSFHDVETPGLTALELVLQFTILGLLAVTVIFAPRINKGRPSTGWAIWIGFLLIAYYGISAFDQGTAAAFSPTAFLAEPILDETFILPYVLAVVYYLAGSDTAEWGEALVASFNRLLAPTPLQRRRFLLHFVVVAFVAILIVVDIYSRMGLSILEPTKVNALSPSLVTASVVLLSVVLCTLVANVNSRWPVNLSLGSLVAGALFLYGAFRLFSLLGLFLLSANGQTSPGIVAGLQVASGLVLVMGLAVGFWRLLAGRRSPAVSSRGTWFFITITALVALPIGGPSALAALGLTVSSPPHYFDALQLLMTVGALLYAIHIVITARGSYSAGSQLLRILMLILSVEIIQWALNAPAFLARFGLATGAAASAIFLLAIIWDVIMSGKDTTNGDGPKHVLQARVTLYLAYTMVATTTLLFLATIRVTTNQATYNPSDVLNVFSALNNFGLLYLGVPVVLCTFLLRTFQRRPFKESTPVKAVDTASTPALSASAISSTQPSLKPIAAPKPKPKPKRKLVIVNENISMLFSLIALLILEVSKKIMKFALGVALLAALILPFYLFAFVNYGVPQRISIHSPGPECDPDYRPVWTFSDSADFTCQSDGMRLTARPDQSWAAVAFRTPSTFFPDNYGVEVSVDLIHLSHGCAALVTHYTSKERYLSYVENYVCAGGQFGIYYCDNLSGICDGVVQAEVPPSNKYTLTTAVSGTNATLIVNGVRISGHIAHNVPTDKVLLFLTGRVNELVGHPVKDPPIGDVVFSDFIFTPLD